VVVDKELDLPIIKAYTDRGRTFEPDSCFKPHKATEDGGRVQHKLSYLLYLKHISISQQSHQPRDLAMRLKDQRFSLFQFTSKLELHKG